MLANSPPPVHTVQKDAKFEAVKAKAKAAVDSEGYMTLSEAVRSTLLMWRMLVSRAPCERRSRVRLRLAQPKLLHAS